MISFYLIIHLLCNYKNFHIIEYVELTLIIPGISLQYIIINAFVDHKHIHLIYLTPQPLVSEYIYHVKTYELKYYS